MSPEVLHQASMVPWLSQTQRLLQRALFWTLAFSEMPQLLQTQGLSLLDFWKLFWLLPCLQFYFPSLAWRCCAMKMFVVPLTLILGRYTHLVKG